MGSYESKLHKPGVTIFRAEGDLSSDDLEKCREELESFIKKNTERGACGVLIDACEVKGFSVDAIDTLMELLSDPEEIINEVRMRFALIGVRPFTQRFLREAMPLTPIKHVRARFFHELAENEALAWLQAMVSSVRDLPEVGKEEVKEDKKKDEKADKKKKVLIPKKPKPAKEPKEAEIFDRRIVWIVFLFLFWNLRRHRQHRGGDG